MDNKPTEITAAEFVSKGYAEKVARGECEVRDYMKDRIVSVTVYEKYDQFTDYLIENHRDDTEHNSNDPTWILDAFDGGAKVFTVTWLQPAPEPAQAGGAGEVDDLQRIWEQFQIEENLATSYAVYCEQEEDLGHKPKSKLVWQSMVIKGMTKQLLNERSALAAAESRLRQAEAALDKVLTQTSLLLTNHASFVNYVYPHGFKADKPDEEYALSLRQDVIETGRNAFDATMS